MNDMTPNQINLRMIGMIGEKSQRNRNLHQLFLSHRLDALHQMRGFIENQMQISWKGLQSCQKGSALFDADQLDAFGKGNFSRCFGPAFACYDNRRIPRIPNGDLKMMTQVTAIQGSPRDFSAPAVVEVEYIVPPDAWYMQDSGLGKTPGKTPGEMPYALLMEIALQPCGFLSAYLDTYAVVPHEVFFFRNLDGEARVNSIVSSGLDLRGRTLLTQSRLLSHVVSVGSVIQKFSFQVFLFRESGDRSMGDEPLVIYEGTSTFGYFSEDAMTAQVGLDNGIKAPLYQDTRLLSSPEVFDLRAWRATPSASGLCLSSGRMGLLDQITFSRDAGLYGYGYIYARQPIDPTDWFFPFHFTDDPVMPGSLGVESILEAMRAYAIAIGLGSEMSSVHFSLPDVKPLTTWRYRGQITPANKEMDLEIHIKEVLHQAGAILVCADANIWVDGLRIYEVKNAAIRIIGMD